MTSLEVATTEGLARKRRIRGGHRSSATRTMNTVDALLVEEETDPAHLAQFKWSLEEKLGILTQLDSEILDLTEDESLDAEIQEAGEFKDRVYRAIVRLDSGNHIPTGSNVMPGTTAVTTSAATLPADAPVVVTTAHTTDSIVMTTVSTAPMEGAVTTAAVEASTVTSTTTVTTPISTPLLSLHSECNYPSSQYSHLMVM